MDRSNDILDRGLNHIENYLNRFPEIEWTEGVMRATLITAKITFKAGIFAVREIGYFFTGIFTLPKERCIIEGIRDFEKLQKLAKIVYPIIIGTLPYFYWGTPLAIPFAIAIIAPSGMFYSTLMICKGIVKVSDWAGVKHVLEFGREEE